MVHVQQGKTGEPAIQHRYFLYDFLGRLIRVKQPEQEVNTALNILDPVTNNSVWTAAMEYDLVGNLKKTIDAKGTTITSEYDKAGRVKTRNYSNEPAGITTPAVQYFYDGKGLTTPQTPNYAKGKLTKVTSSISETLYNSFDNFGRLLQMEQRTPFETETIANATPRISSYQYDFGGRLVAETYPSGRVVKNEFEADGDLQRIASKANANAIEKTYANGFSFTASGGIEKMRLGNGKFETAKFNDRLQITELGLGHSVTDRSLWKVNYEYGELENGSVNINKNTGNIARQTLNFAGLTNPIVQSYKYDSLDRIIDARETSGTAVNAPENWNQTWNYDRFGNRIAFSQNVNGQQLAINSATLPSINPNTNRFNPGQGFAYDKNGNIVSDAVNNGRSFEFNGDNKQTKVFNSSGGEVGKYFYDGEGARVKKVVGNETTIFVYSSGKLIAEYSNATPTTTPTTSYTTTDHLGSPRVITDATGQVKSRRDFMPFGEDLNVGVGARNNLTHKYGSSEDNIKQKFTGYLKDNETNLDFAEARYYSNNHGRFTAVDPLLASGKSANPQTFNRYVYCLNNPVNCTDPTGLDGVWGYRDINGGTQLQFFESQSALDAFNNSQTGCENSICPNYTLYTGGNFFLWADKSVSYLGGNGEQYNFAYSQPDNQEIDSGSWGNLVGSFRGGSFSEEQTADLEGRMNYERQIQSRISTIRDGLDQMDRLFDVERQCKENNQSCAGGFSVRQATVILSEAEKIAKRAASVIAKYRGVEAEGGWLFKNARTAKKAAAEIAGNMGSNASKRPFSEFRGGDRFTRNSQNKWAVNRSDANGNILIQIRNDKLGHSFDNRPHVNVEFFREKLNFHLFY